MTVRDRHGLISYVIDGETDQIITTAQSIAAARRKARTFNAGLSNPRYRVKTLRAYSQSLAVKAGTPPKNPRETPKASARSENNHDN